MAADRSNFLEQTTRPDYLLDPDHQTWQDQTILCVSDRPLEETGSQPARPASSHKHPGSTGQDAIVSYVSQVRTILCGLGHGSLIHFPHTFGLKSLDFLFLLYLIVGREASGVPWAGKGLHYPFSIVTLLFRCSVSDRSSAFQKQFRLRLGVCLSFRRTYFVVSPSSVSSS